MTFFRVVAQEKIACSSGEQSDGADGAADRWPASTMVMLMTKQRVMNAAYDSQ